VCFLSGEDEDWNGPLLEFYPLSVVLARDAGKVVFRKVTKPSRGSGVTPIRSATGGTGTHFNLTVPKTRAALESACAKLGLACSWRGWQGLLEVWLEDELFLECVPA
jgi:hypothetical protein